MRTLRTRYLTALLTACTCFFFLGCGSDSPTALQEGPATPAPQIKTPTKMKITYFVLQEFPNLKSNGDTWDAGITAAPRRPDVYAKLGNYETDTGSNLSSPTSMKLDWEVGFARMNYAGTYKLQLYDEDGVIQGADDFMAEMTSPTFFP